MFSIALSLLLAASSLVVQVQNNPNISDALRNQVYTIASQAIVYAEETLQAQGATVDTSATTTDAISLPTVNLPATTTETTPVVVAPPTQAPVVPAPAVVVNAPIPTPPTCTLTNEAIQPSYDAAGNFRYNFTYLDWTMTGEKVNATINSLPTYKFTPVTLKGGENDFNMVVVDDQGQQATCNDVITLPL